MAEFVGGRSQAEYMTRVRDLPQGKCLVVAVDVGKHGAMGLIADHSGQIAGEPVDFALTVPGAAALEEAVHTAVRHSGAASVRIGIEAAGHYHRAIASQLRERGFDVVELNPYQVKLARGQMGNAMVKTDLRDCMAMIELLVRGQGWPLRAGEAATAEQRAWVAPAGTTSSSISGPSSGPRSQQDVRPVPSPRARTTARSTTATT